MSSQFSQNVITIQFRTNLKNNDLCILSVENVTKEPRFSTAHIIFKYLYILLHCKKQFVKLNNFIFTLHVIINVGYFHDHFFFCKIQNLLIKTNPPVGVGKLKRQKWKTKTHINMKCRVQLLSFYF